MNKPGRPRKDELFERRKKVRRFLVVSALGSEAAISRIATKLQVSERSLRSDLEALRDEIDSDPSSELTETLGQAIEAADTFGLLKALGKKVMHEMVRGTIDRALGTALIDAIREQRHVLLRARDEEAQAAVTALEILTPQEQEVLKEYRESLVPEALKPGEFPPPPEGALLPSPEATLTTDTTDRADATRPERQDDEQGGSES